jgi:hypothetical protein
MGKSLPFLPFHPFELAREKRGAMDRVFRMPLGAGSCCLGAVGLRVMRPALIPCRVRLPCWPQARGYRAGELARGRIRRTSVTEYSAGHSGLMPAARITFAHFSLSSTTSFPKSAGEPRTTVPPRSLRGRRRKALLVLGKAATGCAIVGLVPPLPAVKLKMGDRARGNADVARAKVLQPDVAATCR